MSTRPYAVITGASSGIGLEYAKIFARLGYNLCLIARRENRLRELADKMEGYYGIDCKVISADLSTSKGVEEVCKKVRHLKVEFFLNNAGFGDCGAFSETSNSKEQSMINTNVKAVQALMKFMIKYYKHHKIDGYILNTASSAGLLAQVLIWQPTMLQRLMLQVSRWQWQKNCVRKGAESMWVAFARDR